MPTLADDLVRIPLFGDLSKGQLRKLAKAFKEHTFGPGTTVVREGENSGVGFFVVADGSAKVIVGGKTVATIGPGDYFGELAMITKSARTATVTAETPLRCLTIRFWDFRQFVKENPDVSWKLLEHLAGVLADDRARQTKAP
jgi:CRP-like cAMP-binding protein